jgi:hypothetical protein
VRATVKASLGGRCSEILLLAKNTTDESALALAGADFPSCGALRVVRWINRGAWWTESGSSWALA